MAHPPANAMQKVQGKQFGVIKSVEGLNGRATPLRAAPLSAVPLYPWCHPPLIVPEQFAYWVDPLLETHHSLAEALPC